MPTALVTGITGQDGSYLAELLLDAGYRVVGLHRRLSASNHWRISHLRDRITLVRGDVTDLPSLLDALGHYRPDEVYHLAAQSQVSESWRQPILTGEVTALGTARVLEAVRRVCPGARVYQASSSEMFGLASCESQDETTPFHPRSPYGVSKVYAHHLAINYRESYGLYVACGILFNHESPRRSPEFVTRKITRAVARIRAGLQDRLVLGNLEASRDWGFAGDYVRAMFEMLHQPEPRDYVVATGVTHTVGEFAERAFAEVGLDARDYVVRDPGLERLAEISRLRGNPARARLELGWTPQIDFERLIRKMVASDVEALERGTLDPDEPA